MLFSYWKKNNYARFCFEISAFEQIAFSVQIIVKYVINALQLLELFLRPFTFSNLILPLSLLFTCFLSFRLFEGSRSEGRGSQRTLWYVRRAQVAVVDGNKSNIPVPDTFPDHQDPLENQGRPTLVWGEGKLPLLFNF